MGVSVLWRSEGVAQVERELRPFEAAMKDVVEKFSINTVP